jgi:hypothetical protein
MADIPLPPMPEKNIFDMLFDYCKTNKSLLAKRRGQETGAERKEKRDRQTLVDKNNAKHVYY